METDTGAEWLCWPRPAFNLAPVVRTSVFSVSPHDPQLPELFTEGPDVIAELSGESLSPMGQVDPLVELKGFAITNDEGRQADGERQAAEDD